MNHDSLLSAYEAQLLAWEKKEEPSSPPSAWISDQLHSADDAVARYCSPNTTTSDEMINPKANMRFVCYW